MADETRNVNINVTTNASQAKEEVKGLNKAIAESAEKTEKKTDATNTDTEAVVKNSKSLLDNTGVMGVLNTVTGGYVGVLKDAITSTSNFITTGKYAITTLDAQTTSTVVATTATSGMSGALKVLRYALISTGIGAILVLLGSFISYLSGTQEGLDKVTKVTRPLIAVFESLMGVIQGLGKKMFEAFSKPKELLKDLVNFVKDQVFNRLKGLGMVLDGIFNRDFGKIKEGMLLTGTGVEDVVGKVKNLAKETNEFLNEAIKKGKELDILEKKLTQTRIYNAEALGKLSEELKRQNLLAEDQTKSLKVREGAAVKTIELAKQINKLKQNELNLEVAIMENKQSRNDTSDNEKLDLANLKAKRNASNAQEAELLTTQQNKLNGIRKQGDTIRASQDKAASDKRDKERADERSKHIENEKTRISEEAKSLKTLEDLRDKTEEEKLARQKKRDIEEIRALADKGIDIRQLLKDNTEKYGILEDELRDKRKAEKKVKDDEDDAKDLEDKKVINDALIQQEIDLKEAKFDVASDSVALLSNVFSKSKAIQKASMIAEGAVSIGKMIASNNEANIGALKTPQAIATNGASAIPVMAMNNISTGLGIASTVAATAKALSSLGGGSVAGGSAGASPSASAQPSVSFVASSENQIADSINSNNNSQEPIKAYVVSKEVSTAQELDRNIISSTTI